MKCPNDCATPLVMSERQGVEIDYCPTCRGVWLDKGELDKIIERSHQLEAQLAAATAPAAPAPAAAPAPPQPAPTPYPQAPPQPAPAPYPQAPPQPVATYPAGGYGSPYAYGQHGYKRKKRKGFLDEIFDF